MGDRASKEVLQGQRGCSRGEALYSAGATDQEPVPVRHQAVLIPSMPHHGPVWRS